MRDPPEKLTVFTGYDCLVCKGKNIVETDNEIVHICEGFLIPVYEVVNS